VEFAAEDGRVGQAVFVVGDQSGRGGAGEHVFDNLGVFCGAEENADGGPLVGRIEAADVDQERGVARAPEEVGDEDVFGAFAIEGTEDGDGPGQR